MGPPIYIGGNFCEYDFRFFNQDGFNGATDLHRWKLLNMLFLKTSMRLLQWGHRFTSVETNQGRPVPGVRLASMGPPIYIGGNGQRPHRQGQGLLPASMGPPIYIGGNSPL